MTRHLKSILLVAAGLCWLAVALSIVLFLFFSGSEGEQVVGFFGVTPPTIVFGLIPICGFLAMAGLCALIGLGLCVHGLVPPDAPAPGGQSPGNT
jgi:hypothetical protein